MSAVNVGLEAAEASGSRNNATPEPQETTDYQNGQNGVQGCTGKDSVQGRTELREDILDVYNPTPSQRKRHDRLRDFLLNRVFLPKKAARIEDWEACRVMAWRMMAGAVVTRHFKIQNVELPPKRKRNACAQLKQDFAAVPKGPAESDEHRWLKLVAKRWMDQRETEVEYEGFYGPCCGDVVGKKFVVEVGNTLPYRAECIFDSSVVFISLPYHLTRAFDRKSFHAFAFGTTDLGKSFGIISSRKHREAVHFERMNALGEYLRSSSKPGLFEAPK